MAVGIRSGVPSTLRHFAGTAGADGELVLRKARRLADHDMHDTSALRSEVAATADDVAAHGRRLIALAADVGAYAVALADADARPGVAPNAGVPVDSAKAPTRLDAITWRGRSELGLRTLRSTDARHPVTGKRRRFLQLDPTGDGQAVEVFGDLATADAVAVFVPGMGSDLAGFDRQVSAPAAHLWMRLAEDHPDRSVAVVAWLGYDAPDDIAEAATTRLASRGGAALADLVARLDLDSGVPTSIVAHSYGTVVTAMAMLRDGLEVDNVVAMGSPGMVVGHTRDFDRPDTDFFAMAADGDPVAWISWFGLAPTFPFTGFRRLASEGNGHGSYLDDGSVSLGNVARVVVDEDEEPRAQPAFRRPCRP